MRAEGVNILIKLKRDIRIQPHRLICEIRYVIVTRQTCMVARMVVRIVVRMVVRIVACMVVCMV